MSDHIIKRSILMILLPVIMYLFFMIFAANFNFTSLYVILSQSMTTLLMAYGIAFTFVVGIFEMSVGSQVILSAIIGGICCRYFGFAGLVAGCIASGLILGSIMGLVYKYLKIPTMVISLGLAMIYEVIANLITKGSGYVKVDSGIAILGKMPNNMIIILTAAVLFYLLYHKTKFGYHTRALGNNDAVALNLGINNNSVKFKTYLVGGFFYGITGILYICYSGSITASMQLNSLSMIFTPVAAVLIGIQLKNIIDNFALAIFIGAFSVTMLYTGLIAMGLPSTMQNLFTGVFMLSVLMISVNRNLIKISGIKLKRTNHV